MRLIRSCALVCAFFCGLCACNGGLSVSDRIGGGFSALKSSYSVVLSPSADATAVDSPVIASFNGAITEPAAQSGWLAAFTVREISGDQTTGVSLCTSVSYDATTRTATCSHGDFARGKTYEIGLWNIDDADGYEITGVDQRFTTVAASSSVTAIAKSYQASALDGQGSITFTMSFDEPLGGGDTLALAVEAVAPSAAANIASPAISAGECEEVAGSGASSYSCAITGLAACDTFNQYRATLSLNGTSIESFGFNSADDYFDDSATLTDCWATDIGKTGAAAGYSLSVADGVLTASLALNGATAIYVNLQKQMSITSDYAMHLEIAENDLPLGVAQTGNIVFQMITDMPDGEEGSMTLTSGITNVTGSSGKYLIYSGSNTPPYISWWSAITSNDAALTHLCILRFEDEIAAYVRGDDTEWAKTDSSNFTCILNSGVTNCDGMIVDASLWTTTFSELYNNITFNLWDTNGSTRTYSPKIDSVLYNSAPTAGDSSDCPD